MAIVVDSSGSIGTDNWKLVKKFLQDLVLSIADVGITGAKIALINFSNKCVSDKLLNFYFNLPTSNALRCGISIALQGTFCTRNILLIL